MKLQRLLNMGPAEIAFRSRQQAYKTIECLALTGSDPGAAPRCRFEKRYCDGALLQLLAGLEQADHHAAALQLQGRLQQRISARFFSGAADHRCDQRLMSKQYTAVSQQIIASADAVLRGEFDILGYGPLSFGRPINWHLDPVSNRESPMLHWSRINPLAEHQVGDSKVVWELNRHQWLLDLGQAYRFTGNARYAQCFARLITDWMRNNPPGIGVNWSSALEAAMRLISWCWALLLFRGSEALSAGLFHSMLGWMQLHARFVERYLSRYFSPNTHLTVEALSLFYAGTLLPELRGARRWRVLGRRILIEQIQRQIHPDGVYFEQSTRYQYYTVEIYLHFVILAERNRGVVPRVVYQRLQQMLTFLLHLRRPDGSLPQLGDADGGWLLPLLRRDPGDFRGLFSTAALLFRDSRFAMAAGELAPESLWLLGPAAQQNWSSLAPAPPPVEALRVFREGGYVVMRNRRNARGHQLIFDTGPLGCPVSGGHGHADLLSIQCSAWGENYLVDAGTYCYTADANWRNYFRSSEAHSTVLVDGRSQAQPDRAFSWHSRPSARLRHCLSKPGCIVAEAEHDAYHRLDDPVTHRRRVMFVDERYWLVVDDLCGCATHHIDLRYQFAPLPVAIEDDDWVRAQGRDSALLLRVFSTGDLSCRVGCGELAPPLGWLSANYGQRLAAPMLTCTATARLPLRMVTVLFPLPEPGAEAPALSPLIEQGNIAGLAFTGETEAQIRI